jgi:hypothetical protein
MSLPHANATHAIIYNCTALPFPSFSPPPSSSKPHASSRVPVCFLLYISYSKSRQSFPLPLLMLRIQRANNINMSLPTLASFPSHTLYAISLHPTSLSFSLPFSLPTPSLVNYRGKKSSEHTLQPSQSFLTELLTFIPRTCSPTLVAPFIACICNCGLRRDCNVRCVIVLKVVGC